MKLKTQDGKPVDVHIQAVQFSTHWLRVGQFLCGCSATRLLDAELCVTKISVITQVEFEIPVADGGQWWKDTLQTLEKEFTEQQRVAQVPAPRKARAKIRAAGSDLDFEE